MSRRDEVLSSIRNRLQVCQLATASIVDRPDVADNAQRIAANIGKQLVEIGRELTELAELTADVCNTRDAHLGSDRE
jgi:hypothetical protein